MSPLPQKAIVLCVDEKPSIQALERAQGYLKLPNGRALTGQSHDYKRHGTTTLFAALEVATGKIIATHSKRRRRVEFLDFMNSVTAAFPNRKLHVILDNLSTHKKNEDWLKAHPNVKFHFTPTSASWLNQVEVWFSILQGQSLSGASFTSLKQLQEHIDAYVNAYNDKAEPFVSTKKKVRQRRFKGRRITHLLFRVLDEQNQLSAVESLVPLDEILNGGWYLARLEIAAPAQFASHVLGDVLRPLLVSVEGDDADRIVVLARKEILITISRFAAAS